MPVQSQIKKQLLTLISLASLIFAALCIVKLSPDQKRAMYDDKVYRVITLPRAHFLFTSGHSVFLDARSKMEYGRGHIKGALWAGNESTRNLLGKKESSTVIVYGRKGDAEALRIARDVSAAGKIAYVLDEGWEGWVQLGLPIGTSDA